MRIGSRTVALMPKLLRKTDFWDKDPAFTVDGLLLLLLLLFNDKAFADANKTIKWANTLILPNTEMMSYTILIGMKWIGTQCVCSPSTIFSTTLLTVTVKRTIRGLSLPDGEEFSFQVATTGTTTSAIRWDT